jgi:DNA-binding transcriptional ArsR family regulator
MPKLNLPPPGSAGSSGPDQNLIYAALGDPVRHRILQILADGTPHTATHLAPGVARCLDATLKHLAALRDAGLVLTQPNPADSRRQLYTLPPTVKVTKTEIGMRELDFGCCVMRVQ